MRPTDAPDVTVLLHGWPDSSYSFSRLTPTLAVLGHRTLSVDQRGFGGSSRPRSGYRIDDLPVSEQASWPVTVKKGLADLKVRAGIQGEALNANIKGDLSSLAIDTGSTDESNRLTRALSKAIRGVSSLDVEADVVGTLDAHFDDDLQRSRELDVERWRDAAPAGRFGPASPEGFVPAVIVPAAPEASETREVSAVSADSRMEVVAPNGRRVIVDRGVDVDALLRVMRGLETLR